MSEQIDTALEWASGLFRQHSESPRLDAELLLAHALGKPRSYLYSWPRQALGAEHWRRFQQLVTRRCEPTPLAYLLGTREFYSLEFETSPDALIPRPETELLVDLALARIPPGRPLRILDLGTGAGNIAITLKVHRPDLEIYAADVDPACIELARRNAARHDVAIEFVVSDWYRALPARLRFDLILSNPPYVAAGHPFLAEGDLPAEPELALTPGRTGLEALQPLIAGAPARLVDGGWLIVEHGYDQQAPVARLLVEHGFSDIECAEDANDLPRTTSAKLIENTPPAA